MSSSKNLNSAKVFLANFSELAGRFDPTMILFNRKIKSFRFKTFPLKSLLATSPQYGANESGIERTNRSQPRYVRITDINEFGLLDDSIGVTAERIEEKYLLNEDDILFARSGATVGKAYLHKNSQIDYKCFFAGYMIRFIVDSKKILPEYLFTFTQLNTYKEWVKAIQRAAGQPNINAEEYKSLQIPLPDLETQKKLVDIVDKAYIEKLKKETQAKKLLSSIDQYLLKELGLKLPERNTDLDSRIFVVPFSDIVGMRFDPGYTVKYEFLINQKSKFQFTTLKELLLTSPQYGANEEALEGDPKKDIRYIRITDIDDQGVLKTNVWKTAANTDKRYLLNRNDILFARSGSVGRCYIHRTSEKAIFAGYLIRFVFDPTKALPEFIFNYCNSSIYKFWVSAIERSAVQSNINSEEFKSLPIPLPSIKKQQEIVDHIKKIQLNIEMLKNEAITILENAKFNVEKSIVGEA